MAIQKWSEDTLILEPGDDPQFSDEMQEAMKYLRNGQTPNVVINFSGVGFLNSTSVGKLLQIRKEVHSAKRRIIVCGVNSQVWGLFMVMGLDKLLETTNDMATALASLQIGVKV